MRTIISVLVVLILAAPIFAHEFWLESDSFFLKLNERGQIRLFSGEALKKDEERPYQASKTISFDMLSNDGKFDMRPLVEDESTPFLKFGADHSGTFLLNLERNWSYIKLDAAKFEEYLREDGMEYIIDERKRLGESMKEGSERYSRYIKTILQVGDNRTGAAKTRVASKLEILPLENPYSKKVGENVKLQLLFGGLPLREKMVFADNRDGEQYSTQKLTTDKEGKVTFKLDRKGVWLIRLVHMQRCPKNCGGADWESFWGALSFGVK